MKYRLSQIRIWYDKINKSDDLNDLVNKLNIDRNQLVLLSMSRSYHVFTIPKKDGSFRLIEDPQKNLKELQREFNKYLQAVYYLHQTEAAFGFIIHVKEGKYRKDILNNARRHLGHRYMLKIDLEDFFHQVGIKRVARILQSKPFIFRREPARTLARLFTYKQRLPMGAPTSPVLSNFATMGLDKALYLWAASQNITYTRYADDMTFSSGSTLLTDSHLRQITGICNNYRFELNKEKTVFYGPQDEKKVTGLILTPGGVDIEDGFYVELDEDLVRLKHLVESMIITREDRENPILVKMKQEVKGKINFIGMIEGYQSVQYNTYSNMLYDALHPKEEQLFIRWQHFNYL